MPAKATKKSKSGNARKKKNIKDMKPKANPKGGVRKAGEKPIEY
jgi:hypothetical protein